MMPSVPSPSPEPGNVELVQRAMGDARDLIRLEVALAKNELTDELTAVKGVAIMGGVAFLCALLGLASLIVAFGLTFGPVAVLMLGGGLLVVGAVTGRIAYGRIPKKVMGETTERLKLDETMLKEHLS